MLKLTLSRDNRTILIAPQHITALEPSDKTTVVWIAGQNSPFVVKETGDQILAMEQMVLLFNPAMIINGDQVRRL